MLMQSVPAAGKAQRPPLLWPLTPDAAQQIEERLERDAAVAEMHDAAEEGKVQ